MNLRVRLIRDKLEMGNSLLLEVTLSISNLKTINKINTLYNMLVSRRDQNFTDLRFKGAIIHAKA